MGRVFSAQVHVDYAQHYKQNADYKSYKPKGIVGIVPESPQVNSTGGRHMEPRLLQSAGDKHAVPRVATQLWTAWDWVASTQGRESLLPVLAFICPIFLHSQGHKT